MPSTRRSDASVRVAAPTPAMIAYLARRLLWSLVVLGFVVSVTFAITVFLPADPARMMVGPHGDAETIARVRAQLGLDRPLATQYLRYVGRILGGDLGESFRLRTPVSRILRERAGATAELAFAAVLLQIAIGVPLGVIGAVRRNRGLDAATQVSALLGQSAPTFFIGPMLMWALAFRLELLPISGHGRPGLDRLAHLVLPALTLAVTGVAYYSRLVRGEMIETMAEDYVRTARAKGLSERRVIVRHALRNALVPVVTLAGLDLGQLLGGAIVTEYIFSWPGLGREAVNGILNVDLPVILGVVLVSAVAVLAVNVVVDLAYALLDPRVRLH